MFVHQSQLAYQLVPADYSAPAQHRRELERLMLPAWHLVGSRSDLPGDGQFISRELLGQPVVVHNFQGQLKAFLNVCAHRHCRLTDLPAGRQPTLTCQYHGWEYGPDGYTRRIPDAGCFRPFDRASAHLHPLRLAECGDLVFVSLAEEGPSLESYLGECYSVLAGGTSGPWQCIWRWEHDFPCNWKLGIENTVETYHLPQVHKKTFTGIYPSEEAQTHELEGRGSVLRYDLRESPSVTKLQRRFVWALGGKSTDIYSHYLMYPHLVFTTSDLYNHAQVYLPVTPTTSRAIVRMYSFHGARRDPWHRLLAWIVARGGRNSNQTIQLEDAAVFPALQRGVEASPHTGCLGTREERIWAFQRYIVQQAGSQAAPRDQLQQT